MYLVNWKSVGLPKLFIAIKKGRKTTPLVSFLIGHHYHLTESTAPNDTAGKNKSRDICVQTWLGNLTWHSILQ